MSVKGIDFPMRFGPLGHFERSSGARKLEGNMKCLIATRKRDRDMNPKVGTLAYSAVFRDVKPSIAILIGRESAKAIAAWEPRAQVRRVTCQPSQSGNGISLRCDYRARGQSRENSFDFVTERR